MTRANVGVSRCRGRLGAVSRGRRSAAKNRRNTSSSMAIVTSHGNAIAAVNPANVSPEAPNASRFVRLDTGSSVDAEFARCAQA